MNWIDTTLMISAFALHAAILGSIWRRGLVRIAPIFAVYIAYSFCTSMLQIILARGNYLVYFWMYWTSEAGAIVLSILAVCASFSNTFRYHFAPGWTWRCLSVIAWIAFIYAAWKSYTHPPKDAGSIITAIVNVEYGARFAIGAVFSLFIILSVWLQVSRTGLQASIVSGFGIASCGMLLSSLIRSEFGTQMPTVMRYGPAAAYAVAQLMWLAGVLSPAETKNRILLEPEEALRELKQYSSVLRRQLPPI